MCTQYKNYIAIHIDKQANTHLRVLLFVHRLFTTITLCVKQKQVRGVSNRLLFLAIGMVGIKSNSNKSVSKEEEVKIATAQIKGIVSAAAVFSVFKRQQN